MRPSEIKVGELEKSKKFRTHAAGSCGARSLRRQRCRPLPPGEPQFPRLQNGASDTEFLAGDWH